MKTNKIKKTNTKKQALKFQFIISSILIFVGCFLLIAGFCVAPTGIIDSSVLIAFGEILTFVGAICGIDYSYKKNIAIRKIKEESEDDTED